MQDLQEQVRKELKILQLELEKQLSYLPNMLCELSPQYSSHSSDDSSDEEEFGRLGIQAEKEIHHKPIINQIQMEQCKTFEPDDAEINFLGLNQPLRQMQVQNQQVTLRKVNQEKKDVQVKIKPIYNFGKLLPNTHQILPMIMRVKSRKQRCISDFQGSILIVLDHRINQNNLDMIQMKRCALQLINSHIDNYKIRLLRQDKGCFVQLNKLNILDCINQLHQEQNDSMSIRSIIQQLLDCIRKDYGMKNYAIIHFCHYQGDFTSQVYKYLIKDNNLIEKFTRRYLLEFGNPNNMLIQNQDNVQYFQITKYEDILDVIDTIYDKYNQLNCKIQIKCLSINDCGQIALNHVCHDVNPIGNTQFEISIKKIRSKFKNYYAFEIILPKAGLNYKHQEQIDILDVQVQYIDQTNNVTRYDEKQTTSLNIVQNHLVVPSDSLNENAVILFYTHLTYYYLEQCRIKEAQANEIKSWLLQYFTEKKYSKEVQDKMQMLYELIVNFQIDAKQNENMKQQI